MPDITPSATLVRVFVFAILIGLTSCANRQGVSQGPSEAIAFLQKSRQAVDIPAQLGLAVAAADAAAKEIAAGGGEKSRLAYNDACAEVAALASRVPLPLNLETPAGPVRLNAAPGSRNTWKPGYFSRLIPTSKIKNKTLVGKLPPDGFGGALVGVHQPENPRALFYPRAGVSAPVTAVVTTTRGRAGAPATATLTLFDPAKIDSARVAGATRPLAADLSAPFGFYPVPPKVGILGMLRPQRFLNQEGLFLTQPYDPKKIPLVMIHGLMSDPFMWLPVMAAIENEPDLRAKYQMWVFAYPTGNPIGFSALELRKQLTALYKVYPESSDMVIVNHSLGGVITHLQVISPGDALVKGIFKDKAPEIMAQPDSSALKQALVYKANPRIERVVFVAAPHRGAPLASNPLGNIGASLIRVPGAVLNQIGTATIQAAAAAAGMKANFVPNSINALSPKSPLLVAMNTVPIEAPFHSIIGVAGQPKSPLEKTSDTVVPYWSAHLDGALSEKIVPYPHTAMFAKPEATDEIIRILRLNLKERGRE